MPPAVSSDPPPAPADRTQVLIAARNFHPELGGGAERFRRYLPGLSRRGVDLRVITVTQDPALPPHGLLENGQPIHRLHLSNTTPGDSDLALAQAVSRHTGPRAPHGPPHIVQFFGLKLAMLPHLWRLRLRRIPILQVITIIGKEPHALPAQNYKRLLLKLLIRHIEGLCNRIIVGSSPMAEARLSYGAIPAQIQIISHGVDLQRFCPPSPDQRAHLRQRLGIPPDTIALLFVGGLTPRKRVDWLIQAFRQIHHRHPQARLYLVGPAHRPTMYDAQEADQQSHFQKQLNALAGPELGQSIHLLGETDTPQDWLRAADLFTFASENEGFPNVLLEAMAAGLPIVTTPFIGLAPELGQPGTHFHLTGENPDSLAEGLHTALDSPAYRAQLSTTALAHVRQQHDLEKTLDQYAALYHSLAR